MHRSFSRKSLIVASAAATLAIPALVGVTAAQSVQPGSHLYSTQSQCASAVTAARNSGKKIQQNCTYSGPMFLWMQTASGPWLAVF